MSATQSRVIVIRSALRVMSKVSLELENKLLSLMHVCMRRRQGCLPHAQRLVRPLNGQMKITSLSKSEIGAEGF